MNRTILALIIVSETMSLQSCGGKTRPTAAVTSSANTTVAIASKPKTTHTPVAPHQESSRKPSASRSLTDMPPQFPCPTAYKLEWQARLAPDSLNVAIQLEQAGEKYVVCAGNAGNLRDRYTAYMSASFAASSAAANAL